MIGKDYEADLEHGDPFVDQKLEGIHVFNTVKQRLREHVIFLQIQFGEKTKLIGNISTRMHRHKFTKKNYSLQIKGMFLTTRPVRIWNNLPFGIVETKEYTHLTILMLF